jgi:hypothetical protein
MAKSAKRKNVSKPDAKRRVAPKKDVGRIRLGSILLAAGALLVVVGLFVLLRPEPPGSAAALTPRPAITPDLRLLQRSASPVVPTSPSATLAGSTQVTPRVSQPSAETVKRIAPAELQRRLGEEVSPLVWEIRSEAAYQKQHIPGSQLITMADVPLLAQSLDREQAIVINCD